MVLHGWFKSFVVESCRDLVASILKPNFFGRLLVSLASVESMVAKSFFTFRWYLGLAGGLCT